MAESGVGSFADRERLRMLEIVTAGALAHLGVEHLLVELLDRVP